MWKTDCGRFLGSIGVPAVGFGTCSVVVRGEEGGIPVACKFGETERLAHEYRILHSLGADYNRKRYIVPAPTWASCTSMDVPYSYGFTRCRLESVLTFPFYDHGDLFSVVDAAPLSESATKWCVSQLLFAVQTLHGHNVAHGDIKLENLLVRDVWSQHDEVFYDILLADFDCAVSLTRQDVRCFGSGEYAAPELRMVESGTGSVLDVDSKCTDVWAIGIVVGVCLLQRAPSSTSMGPLSKLATSFIEAACAFGQSPDHRWTVDMLLAHPWLE